MRPIYFVELLLQAKKGLLFGCWIKVNFWRRNSELERLRKEATVAGIIPTCAWRDSGKPLETAG